MDTDKVPGKLRLRSEKAAAFTLMEVIVAVLVLTTISTALFGPLDLLLRPENQPRRRTCHPDHDAEARGRSFVHLKS